MTKGQHITLRLVLVFLVGSALSFSPSASSVTQKIQNAQSAVEVGDYQSQGEILMNIVEENPWWIDLLEPAGEAFYQAGNLEGAISSFDQALEKGILSREGQIMLGFSYSEIGDFESARGIWSSLEGDPQASVLLAELAEQRGEIETALQYWEDYLSLAVPSEDQVRVLHYAFLLASHSPAESLDYLDQAAEGNLQAAELADAIRGSLGEPKAYQLVISGQTLASQNQWPLAAHAFQRAVNLRPDFQEAYLYWGEALQRLEVPPDDPLLVLEQGLALDELAPLANLFLGLYWQREGSHELALDYFAIAEESWGDQPELYVEQGRSLAALGDLETALERYQLAIEKAPLDADQHRQLAEFSVAYAYLIREVGLPAARIAVQLEPQNPTNLGSLAEVLIKLEDRLTAIALLNQAVELDPAYARGYFQLGIIHTALNDPELAVYYLEQALIYSDNPALTDQISRLLATY